MRLIEDDPLSGFSPMAADDWPVEVLDKWPAGRLRPSAMAAYDSLAAAGEVVPIGTRRMRDGAIIVSYRAQIPPEWVHDLLRKAESRCLSRS